MKIEGESLVIKDPYLVNFVKEHADEDFLISCEDMLTRIFKICEKNLKGDGSVDKFISHMKLLKEDITKEVVTEISKKDMKVDLEPIASHYKELKDKIDITREKIDVVSVMRNSSSTREDTILNNIYHNQKGIESLNSKLDDMKSVRNTNKYKGESAEEELKELLEKTFQMRDNYEIVETKAIPNNCDFVIKRLGHCDIRVECKNYKYDVGTAEIRKFESDLLGLDSHGIFVSTTTKICGKGHIEVNMLHNNRFAIYLSSNNYDGDIIKDMALLIYKLDSMNSDKNFKITPESVVMIKTLLTDYIIKLKSIKTHMKASLDLLGEISLANIEILVSGGNLKPPDQEHICGLCDRTFKSASGLTRHSGSCKKNNTE